MMRQRVLFGALVAMALVLAACTPDVPPPAGHEVTYITRDGLDSYQFEASETQVVAKASGSNGGSNSRTLLWSTESSQSRDQATCATFTSGIWPIQEGVALRISRNGEHTRAVTVMKNIFFYATSYFNVQLIDTSSATPYSAPVPSADFTLALNGHSGPWRLCAKAAGNQLSYKVWPVASSEPDWADGSGVRTITLPEGWTYPGRTGVYAGHLPAGTTATFNDIASEYY